MNVFQLLSLATLWLIVVSSDNCRNTFLRGEENIGNIKAELHLQTDELPSVLFDLKSVSSAPVPAGFREYDCSYRAEGRTAKFRIQFKQTQPASGRIPLAPAEGKFLAVAGSQNSALMQALKKALDAKKMPETSRRVKELAFDGVILGENQSREPSGSFSSKPPGDWIAIKIFLPKGGDDGELFLNLNPTLGKGEFSIKDPDYGDYLLQEFAKVL